MNIINIHKRILSQPISKVGTLLNTLTTKNDRILATDKWSPMKLDQGLKIGSKGGHGPIKYFVIDYQPEKSITFQFDMKGFNGFHRFEIEELDTNQTEISHCIHMKTTGSATLKWILAIRWLHDAYIEDAFDKVENHFSRHKKNSTWSLWVKILRKIMKPKRRKIIY